MVMKLLRVGSLLKHMRVMQKLTFKFSANKERPVIFSMTGLFVLLNVETNL